MATLTRNSKKPTDNYLLRKWSDMARGKTKAERLADSKDLEKQWGNFWPGAEKKQRGKAKKRTNPVMTIRPLSGEQVRSIVREEIQRNPAPSLVGNVVGTFFPLDTMRQLGQGATNDMRRLAGNPRRRNFTITEEMENDAVVIDGRHWLKIDASKLPSGKPCVKHPGDQYSYRAGDLSGKVYIPLNGNLSNYRQRNPGETAADVFEGFHGTPATRTEVFEDRILIEDSLAECGPLQSIRVKTVTGFTTTIKFDKDRQPILCSSPDRNQLYIIGGDQELDLYGLGFEGESEIKHLMKIGVAKQVTYFAKKGFDNFEPTDYFHDLGEESGTKPDLMYDSLNKTLSLVGGNYRVLNEGITD